MTDKRPVKRDRQEKIQGYFDPQIEREAYVLDVWKYYKQQGFTQAQFITEAVMALGEAHNDPSIPMSSTWQDTMLKKIMNSLSNLSTMIASGNLIVNTDNLPSNEQRRHLEEMDGLAKSVAERLQGVAYNPDEIEDEEWDDE